MLSFCGLNLKRSQFCNESSIQLIKILAITLRRDTKNEGGVVMKTVLFSFMCCLISVYAVAGHDPSISVTIDGKVYSCSDSGLPPSNDCSGMAQAFERKAQTCLDTYKGYVEKTEFCVRDEWKKFKKLNNGLCNYQASGACFNLCATNYKGYMEKVSFCNSMCSTD